MEKKNRSRPKYTFDTYAIDIKSHGTKSVLLSFHVPSSADFGVEPEKRRLFPNSLFYGSSPKVEVD